MRQPDGDGRQLMHEPRSFQTWRLPTLRVQLARRCPFYYGWVVFTIAASTSYAARPLMSVAVLSVFMVPMTDAFGWSRGLFAGAVSLGGVCAVIISPIVGRLIDRYGSGWVISATSAVAGACAVGLAGISQSWTFYGLYVPGRMVFASPLELATSTAISNWFIRRRSLALGLLGVTQGTGLAAMPLVAQQLIATWGWRSAWAFLGLFTMAVGIAPALLLMARRPEDMSLDPDPTPRRSARPAGLRLRDAQAGRRGLDARRGRERQFTLGQALRTRAFWVLAVFSASGFMVQAGVSLHQVGHYIRQGVPASSAAIMASVFALAQVPGGLLWSAITTSIPVRYVLAIAGVCVALGATGTAISSTLAGGIVSAAVLGGGVGGLHVLLRLAWADYYGRQHLGTIRGITLPVQIGGQAVGPIAAGFVFDSSGSYRMIFLCFAAVVVLGSLLVLTAVPPSDADVSS
ncbi:MAG TPA: MFS transporter [Candidatus Tectomicrobia bacterium]|nr:MFS transporter [Candidatus Tectomicrobia bacterium]